MTPEECEQKLDRLTLQLQHAVEEVTQLAARVPKGRDVYGDDHGPGYWIDTDTYQALEASLKAIHDWAAECITAIRKENS